MDFLRIFEYSFIIRAFEAGTIVAIIAPLIGTFLVLRRYSLIADTLSHVSLAGLSLGTFLGINPLFTALGVTLASSFGIDRLRSARKIYGESVLALFLSGSLAIAVILFGLAKNFNTKLINYLFGSILTVTATEVYTILILGILILLVIKLFYKELVFTTFDEEAAKVSGIPTKFINSLLIILSALTVSLSIPIVGVLLISALIVIPTITALEFKTSLIRSIMYAEIISLFSVLSGIVLSFYFNLATGGTIVLIMLTIFAGVVSMKRN